MTNIDYSYGLFGGTTSSLELSDIIFGYVHVKEQHVRKAEPAVVFTPDGRINFQRSCYVNDPPRKDDSPQGEVVRFSAQEVEEHIHKRYSGYEIIREPES